MSPPRGSYSSGPLKAESQSNGGLSLAVPPELVEALAERVVDLLAERLPDQPEPWLDVDAAAEYLAAPRSRIYALVSERRVRFRKDGRRVLFRRQWLDDCLGEEGVA